MRTRRSRRVDAPPAEVWAVVADPYHHPRWWPRVQRVEGVTDDAWTSVYTTAKGRAVRADYVIEGVEHGRRLVWSQELEGTPFERVLDSSVYDVTLTGAGGATDVQLGWDQGLRGFSRLGGFMVRRAARKTLDEALQGLARAVE